MKVFQNPQRRILSKFQVDRFAAVSVMSHRARNLSPGANASFVSKTAASVDDDHVPTADMADEPGRLVRQGTFPLKSRSSLRKKDSFRRTKSFRVTFAETITTNEGESSKVVPPVTPSESVVPEIKELQLFETINTSKKKIANRKKPVRRPTSHVPNLNLPPDDEDDDAGEGPSPSARERRPSLSQLIDKNVITPVEEKLRQLASKYRKVKEEPKSRIPVPVGYKSNRVSSLASKFERQFSAN